MAKEMPEKDATPDEAFDLGWISGHDFVIRTLLSAFVDTDAGNRIAEYVGSDAYLRALNAEH